MKPNADTDNGQDCNVQFDIPGLRNAHPAIALLLSGSLLFLSACQTLGVDVYEPKPVAPSATPQTAENAGASDPRTRIGANEHPRIIASYGGEFRDAKTERLVARIVGALTLVSENPQPGLSHHRSQFSRGQRLRLAGRLSLCHPRTAGARQ
jgi:hypothetical protein